jgi:hypothetical protein
MMSILLNDPADIPRLHTMITTIDENSRIRRVVFATNLTKEVSLENLIDKMLIPRPWWRIHDEHATEIILHRIARELEPQIRFLTSISFPSSETCAVTPILIGRYDCIHPGWGAVLGMYDITMKQFPNLILQPYVSRSNNPNENTAFITGKDCLNQTNKWLCAFLPSTNCTLPSIVTDCNSTNCIPADNYQFTTFFSHANRTGTIVDIKNSPTEVRLKYQTDLHSTKQKLLSHIRKPTNRLILPYDQTIYTSRWPLIEPSYSPTIHYFLLRYNSFYRKQMMKYLKHFFDMTIPSFKSTDTCTAIHFRRGDRATAMDHHDIREICYNATHEPKLCLDQSQHLHPCGSAVDYGCYGVPFGLINFNRTVSHIESLIGPNVHHTSSPHSPTSSHHNSTTKQNVLLLSDDHEWLVTEVQQLKLTNPILSAKYNFHIPSPDMLNQPFPSTKNRPHDQAYQAYISMRSNSGTQSGVYFHSSIKLIQQCHSFIGHMGSSVTRLFYKMMCHTHSGLEGYCPPLYNLEWDKEYYDEILHEHWDKLGLKYEKRRI